MYHLIAHYTDKNPYRFFFLMNDKLYYHLDTNGTWYASIEQAANAFYNGPPVSRKAEAEILSLSIWSGTTLPTKNSHPELFI